MIYQHLMMSIVNSEQERSFSILVATRCQSFASTPHHIHTSHNKKVRDEDFLLPLPLLLLSPSPKHHRSCGKSFPRFSKSLGLLRHQQSQELWQDIGWWHWGKMPLTCSLSRVRPELPHSLAPAMAAAHLLTTAWDLFLVHMHRETERSHTGILSAARNYGNKRI